MQPNQQPENQNQPQAATPIPQPVAHSMPETNNGDYPGKTLGVVGIILAIIMPIVGLIISIIAHKQSKKAGHTNAIAKAGIIVGSILTALGIIASIIMIIVLVPVFQKCNELGPGVHQQGNVTYTCS